MKKIALLFIFLFTTQLVVAQDCSEIISEAEEAYRQGRFKDIQPICHCFGDYKKKEKNKLYKNMEIIIKELEKLEGRYAHLLGDYKNYSDSLRKYSVNKTNPEKVFNQEERMRAFVVLSKTYETLGAIKIAELFVQYIIIKHPYLIINETSGPVQQIYDHQIGEVKRFSAGAIIAWSYPFAMPQNTNREVKPIYSGSITEGNIILGGEFNFILSDNWAISLNLLWHNTKIEYIEPDNLDPNQFNFLHQEKQVWFKLPVMVKYTHEKLRWLEKVKDLEAQLYFRGGLSFNFLSNAKAHIVDKKMSVTLYKFDVTDGRHRDNYDVLVGVGSKFRFGRHHINFGLTGTYGLKDVLDQSKVGSNDNPLFREYGIKENNYRIYSFYWFVSYEIRFNTLKNKNK